MDLRFNYDHIRRQIDEADIMGFDPESTLVKHIKQDMYFHIDAILELEEQRRNIDRLIKKHRKELKDTASKWDI